MAHKLFTLAEANRTLPLVKRVVQDILTVYPQWKDLVAQYELIAAQARPDWGESKEQIDLKAQIDAEPERSEEHTSELQSLRHLVCRLLLEKKKKKKKEKNKPIKKKVHDLTTKR